MRIPTRSSPGSARSQATLPERAAFACGLASSGGREAAYLQHSRCLQLEIKFAPTRQIVEPPAPPGVTPPSNPRMNARFAPEADFARSLLQRSARGKGDQLHVTLRCAGGDAAIESRGFPFPALISPQARKRLYGRPSFGRRSRIDPVEMQGLPRLQMAGSGRWNPQHLQMWRSYLPDCAEPCETAAYEGATLETPPRSIKAGHRGCRDTVADPTIRWCPRP